MSRSNASEPVEVTCPNCGRVRRVSYGYASKPTFKGYCHGCKNSWRKNPKPIATNPVLDNAPSPTKSEAKTRTCLKCGKRFKSQWNGNRRCALCNITVARMTDPLGFFEAGW